MAKNDMLVMWVNQIPQRPIAIDVRDQNGNLANMSNYTSFELAMLGSDNEVIDTSGGQLLAGGAAQGRFVYQWPKDKSLFTKTGDYVMQLIAIADGARDVTTEHTIRVKKLGGTR